MLKYNVPTYVNYFIRVSSYGKLINRTGFILNCKSFSRQHLKKMQNNEIFEIVVRLSQLI